MKFHFNQKNKTVYQVCREKAAEPVQGVMPERIEKIENERMLPQPEDILAMSAAYAHPIFAITIVPINVPLASNMCRKQECLIEIAVDNRIDNHELEDFVEIQAELEKISVTVETLQLWVERMLASGAIDMEAYHAHKNK